MLEWFSCCLLFMYCSCFPLLSLPNNVWRLIVFALFLIIFIHYITRTVVGWCIAILRFFFTIIITSPRLKLDDVMLFYVSFSLLLSSQTKYGNLLFLHRFLLLLLLLLLLLHHPDCSRVMYCYSTFLFHYYYYSYYSSSYYYYSSTHFCPLDFSKMPWSNFMKPCRNIICHVKLCC